VVGLCHRRSCSGAVALRVGWLFSSYPNWTPLIDQAFIISMPPSTA
jgi:hypothetical protein